MVLLTNCQLTDLLLTKLVALVFFSTRLATLVYLITHNKAMGYLLIFHSEPVIIYVVLGTYLFLDICLFLGSFINTKWIFIVWQIAALLWVMISILEIFFHETFRDFILGLLSIILTCWACLVLYRAMQEIDEERERRQLALQMVNHRQKGFTRTI